jgi:type IV secretory pathway VirB2 component (pilin)
MKSLLLEVLYVVMALIVIAGIMCALYLKEYGSAVLIVAGLVVFFLGRKLSSDTSKKK